VQQCSDEDLFELPHVLAA